MPDVLIVPWSSRFHGAGMEEGPEQLVRALGARVTASIEIDHSLPPAEALVDGLPRLADAVARSGEEPVLALLGECTLAPGVVAGLQRRVGDVAVIWLDAHGDLNTPETSPSGFVGGMPFAILLGAGLPEAAAAAGLRPVPPEACALVGARDLDPGEEELIERVGLASVDDVEAALRALPPMPVYLHVDADVLDPEIAPAADFAAPDGWSAERLVEAVRRVATDRPLAGVGVCLGNPRRDPEGRTAEILRTVLATLDERRGG